MHFCICVLEMSHFDDQAFGEEARSEFLKQKLFPCASIKVCFILKRIQTNKKHYKAQSDEVYTTTNPETNPYKGT